MSDENNAAVWFFSGDLMFASRVQGAAQRVGLDFALMSRWPEAADRSPALIIVDLSTKSAASTEICQWAKTQFPLVRCLAYGPHVQPARLAKARQDGFTTVLTRGQFDALLPSLFDAAQ